MLRKCHWIVAGALCLAVAGPVYAQKGGKQRARLPQFDQATASQVFFDDVFSRLDGERPAEPGRAPQPLAGTAGGGQGPQAAGQQAGGSTHAWAAIISPTTVEDEIKAIKLDLDQKVTTPSDFAGRGYRVARKQFTVLAMLFAIIGEYDDQVRWKDDAPVARDLFARVASNAKAGSVQVYNESKLRITDLDDLIRGSRLQDQEADAEADWETICDRSPLMQRMEDSFQNKLAPWTANQSDFKSNSEQILHEAELLAAMSEVLIKDGMLDAGDEDYDGYSTRMKQAALEIVDAVKLDNHDQANQAVGEIRKACSECHELYRG